MTNPYLGLILNYGNSAAKEYLHLCPRVAQDIMLNYAELIAALSSSSYASRIKLLNDLKEKNEIYHGGEYVVYLKELFPVYMELLRSIPPQVRNYLRYILSINYSPPFLYPLV